MRPLAAPSSRDTLARQARLFEVEVTLDAADRLDADRPVTAQPQERRPLDAAPLPAPRAPPDAERAAQAGESAAAQDAFWPMHDALYGLRGRLGTEDILGAARALGLDAERIRDDLDAGTYAARVQADADSAVASGVSGTPSFFAGGERHEGAFDAQSLIAALEGG
jgi:predicted DsbA family dithiol-disulfide isomerase